MLPHYRIELAMNTKRHSREEVKARALLNGYHRKQAYRLDRDWVTSGANRLSSSNRLPRTAMFACSNSGILV